MRLPAITIAWVLGIFFAANQTGIAPRWWGIAVLLAFAAVVLACGKRWRWLVYVPFWFVLGAFWFLRVPAISGLVSFHGVPLALDGVIAAVPDVGDDGIRVRVTAIQVFDGVNAYAAFGDALVFLPRTVSVNLGDQINVSGILRVPGQYDTFSYSDYLARDGVFSVMRDATLNLVAPTPPTFAMQLNALKQQSRQRINQWLPEPAAGLLTGILLGDSDGMSADLAADFSTVGASHIIAISGFNMAIIAGVAQQILARSRLRDRAGAIIVITLLVVYGFFVGMSASVLRAVLMASMLLVAKALQRRTFLPATIAGAVFIMTVFDPYSVWDVGFQLSFAAVMGIAMLVPVLQARFERLLAAGLPSDQVARVSGILGDTLIVTLAAQIATLPLMLLYFGNLSVMGLLVNVLILPVQPAIVVLGMLALLVGAWVPLAGGIIVLPVFVFLEWTIEVVRAFARLPFASVELAVDPRVLLWGAVIGWGWMMFRSWRPALTKRIVQLIQSHALRTTVLVTGGVMAALLWITVVGRADGQLHVWWLDMGHSNAVLLQTPQGAQILVDGGRYPTRLLTALGDRMSWDDRTIEMLILSAANDFNTGALPEVLSRYSVGTVLTNGQANVGALQTQLNDLLESVPSVVAGTGTSVQTSDGVTIEVLSPATVPVLGAPVGDGVLVLRVSYGERSFLLTSDASREAQTSLMTQSDPQADVLQLPNHGTARSLNAAFAAAVQPSLVVLQSDLANGRGDPDAETLQLITPLPILRTDQTGTIHLVTDGQQIWSVSDRTASAP